MKTVKALINATGNKSMGNHSVKHIGQRRYFKYHDTIICIVDDVLKTFSVNHHGWFTQSTSRAINAYVRELSDSYKLVSIDGIEC